MVVSASRVEEAILESPVSIEKMGVKAIENAPGASYYESLANLKGVQVNSGSLTFKTLNTRGFSDMQNVRFVVLNDGVDLSAPGLNYTIGDIAGSGELDLKSIEIIPGAASALYGPNAFNGIMFVHSKSPFDYQGLSAQVKVGVTNQELAGANLYTLSLIHI